MHAFVCVRVHAYDENVKSLYSLYTCLTTCALAMKRPGLCEVCVRERERETERERERGEGDMDL